jgi:hypothetical protein
MQVFSYFLGRRLLGGAATSHEREDERNKVDEATWETKYLVILFWNIECQYRSQFEDNIERVSMKR